MRVSRFVASFPLLVLAVAGLHAQESASRISWSGFGTLGVVHSNEVQADFADNILAPNGAGYTSPLSAAVDSRVALQMNTRITDRLSAMVQVMVSQQYDDAYWPDVEWAFLKAELTPDVNVRVGRMVLPSFLVSDDRKVGYAIPWVRPPVEVYWLVPITNVDGIDASYRMQWGDAINSVQVLYGNDEAHGPTQTNVPPGNAYIRGEAGIVDTFEEGPLTARLDYHRTHLTVPNDLFNQYLNFGAAGAAIYETYACNGKLIPLRSFGVDFDPGDWFAMAEYARSDSRCFVGSQEGWYTTGGVRLGDFTPYATYARLHAIGSTTSPGLSLTGLPPALAGYAAGLNAGLDATLQTIGSDHSLSAGLRWDFRRNMDAKLQIDRVWLEGGSTGVLINIQPAFRPGAAYNLLTATVDFVFLSEAMLSVRRILVFALALVVSVHTGAVAADIVVVVSAKSHVQSLTEGEIQDIFLGRAARFPDGEAATPIDLSYDSPARTAFYRNVIHMSEAQVRAHWSKILFTGRGQPPEQLVDDGKAAQRIADNPNAIGYVSRDRVDSRLRIVARATPAP